jgi:hypothetical protein
LNSGIFTCEHLGLYLISVYIVTNTNHGSYHVYKNADAIADAFASLADYYQTASTTVVEHLSVNDTIAKTGWLRIRIMCPSGATCLPADCCFSELAL